MYNCALYSFKGKRGKSSERARAKERERERDFFFFQMTILKSTFKELCCEKSSKYICSKNHKNVNSNKMMPWDIKISDFHDSMRDTCSKQQW